MDRGVRGGDAAEIGFDDREFSRQMALPPDVRTIPAQELCRAEALELIREYARMPGKRHY